MTLPPVLQCQGIEKRFGLVSVLRDVSLALPAGHTLGLVGENGAGKSTLMNILGGNLQADAGRMLLEGNEYSPRTADEATRHGIAFIHQELNLFPNLTVAENIFLTAFPRRAFWPAIDGRALRERARELLAQVGLTVSPEIPVERLSAGERQLIEIAKALSIEARLVIFDEPTTSLSARETEVLFALISRLRARGLAMIYISHTIEHVLRLCDDIIVLRDGEVVGAGPRAEFTAERMISLMVGRTLNQLFPNRSGKPRDEVVLEAKGITQPGVAHNISLQVRRGEIVGLSGLMGAGRSEVARMLFGLEPFASGEIRLLGEDIRRRRTTRRIEHGMAFLTENRREEGLCLDAAIADNIALVSLRDQARSPLGLLNASRIRDAVRTIRSAVRLTPAARDEQPVKTLSGGNQQKVVLAKWLLAKPSMLILDEPTRGIDVGAKYEIYQLINQLADDGAAILVISSELEELIGLCDRIHVMSHGEIRDSLPRAEFDRERILRAALHDQKKISQ